MTILSSDIQVGDPSSWDVLDEDWNSLTGWTKSGTGTSEISPAGNIHVLPDSNNYIVESKTVTALQTLNQTTVEFRDYYDALGTFASGNIVYLAWRDATHIIQLSINTDGVASLDENNNMVRIRDFQIKTGTWYVWRCLIDSTNHILSLFLQYNGQWYNVGSCYTLRNETGFTGLVYAVQNFRAPSGSCEMHRDYFRIASGLYVPTEFIPLSTTNLDINVDVTAHASLQMAMPTDVTHNAETYPGADWTQTTSGGAVIGQSTDWFKSGSHCIKYQGSGADSARLSYSIIPVNILDGLSAWCRVSSITLGHVARLFYWYNDGGGTAANERLLNICVKNVGGIYFIGWIAKIGTATHVLKLSNIVVQANTDFYVDLINSVTEYDGTTLAVNGMVALNSMSIFSASILPTEIGFGSRGGETTYAGTCVAYIDELWYGNTYLPRISSIEIAPNGATVMAVSRRLYHALDNTSKISILTGNLDGSGILFQQYLDTTSYDDQPVGIVRSGTSLYLFICRQVYGSGSATRTTVFKSINSGVTFSEVATNDTYLAYPSKLIQGGKIFCGGWYLPVIGGGPSGYVDCLWFDTATDTFDSPVGRIATPGDASASYWPNETYAYIDPSDGAIVSIIRWDRSSYMPYTSYRRSLDGGVTWGTLTSLLASWGNIAGMAHPRYANGSLWVLGYRAKVNAWYTSVLLLCDPDTLQILNEWDMGYPDSGYLEPGNGDLVFKSDDSAAYLTVTNGATQYLRVTGAGFADVITSGYALLHQMQRRRRSINA